MPNRIIKEQKSIISIHDINDKSVHLISTAINRKLAYAKKEFWNVIHELKEMYNISHMDAIDIVLDEFAKLGLNSEINVTTKNIAIFRISCWNTAKVFGETLINLDTNSLESSK